VCRPSHGTAFAQLRCMDSTKPYAGILAQEQARSFEAAVDVLQPRQWRITDTAVPFGEVMRWLVKMATGAMIIQLVIFALLLVIWLILLALGVGFTALSLRA
jgi:hypothetical protein